MNTKTMEGLVGAGNSIHMINTPMRIFKEGRRKGDTATMERAMGYVSEFQGKAEQYKSEATEGMKEDIIDKVEISEEGRALSEEKAKERNVEEKNVGEKDQVLDFENPQCYTVTNSKQKGYDEE